MRLFELFATLGLDSGEFDKGIDSATKKGEGSSTRLQKSFGLIKGAIIAAASIATIKKIGDAFTAMGEKADTIDESSQKLGLSAKAYQEWAYVLGQNGGNIESFGVGMKTLQNAMAQGTDATENALNKLGLSSAALSKMTPEDALAATIKAFQEMPAGAEKTALAMDLFGKQGMELMPTLNQTADATEALKQRAHDLGLVLSDEAIEAGGKFADNMETLKLAFSAVGTNIIAKLMPSISKFIEKILPLITRILPKLTDAFGAIFEAIWPLIEGGLNVFTDLLTWVADNIDTLIPIVGVLVAALVAWQVVQLALNIAAMANPVMLIVIGVVALIAAIVALVQNFDAVKEWLNGVGIWIYNNVIAPVGQFFSDLWTSISQWASDTWDTIVSVWEVVAQWFTDNIITPVVSAFSAFWLTVSGLFSSLWAWVKGVWEGAKKWFYDNVINPIASAFSNFWNGIKQSASDTWGAIVGFVQTAIDKIKEFFGLKASGGNTPYAPGDSSATQYNPTSLLPFATGIDYVPYDMTAKIHKGEAVLTGLKADNWRNGSSQTVVGATAQEIATAVAAALQNVRVVMGRETVGVLVASTVSSVIGESAHSLRYA